MKLCLVDADALERGKLRTSVIACPSDRRPVSVIAGTKAAGFFNIREFKLCALGAEADYAAMAFVRAQGGRFSEAQPRDFDAAMREELSLYPLYRKTVEFARAAHGAQRYGMLPYMYHLQQVEKVLAYFYDELPVGEGMTLRIVARLHDVLEDTPIARPEMQAAFSERITNLVENVTKRGDEDAEGFEADYYRKVANDPLSILVKIADKGANAKQTVKIYSPPHASKMLAGQDLFRDSVYDGVEAPRMKSYLDALMSRLELLMRQRSDASLRFGQAPSQAVLA